MSSNRSSKSQVARALIALVAAAAATGALAAPASAAAGQGTTAIVLAEHSKGRTLSGQGVKVLAAAPASKDGRTMTLPVSAVDPGGSASATAEGGLSFRRGKRSVDLSELRFNLTAGSLSGKLGGETIEVFKLDGPASANPSSGNVALDGAKLRLTAAAAGALKQELGLARALRRDGAGMAWLSAKANPTHETKAITSGGANWGVLASWRAYVLGQQGPPPPSVIGTISTAGGATANGTLASPGAFFSFPAASGSFEKGLYGATDELVLRTQGSVKFEKPMHCIVEVQLAGLEVTLDGAKSSLTLDSRFDIDTPNKVTHSCEPNPPLITGDVEFASLDPSGITPAYSADGKTVTWAAIPAELTAAGAAAFGAGYPAGQPLDPVTITVGIG
jgi:hypothetical protein